MLLISPPIEGVAAGLTAIASFFIRLWRTSAAVSKAHIQLGICQADVANLKTETRELRDQNIKTDVMVTNIMQQLSAQGSNLDRVEDKTDKVISSVAALTASVDALTSNFDRMENK
jgi:hypothetical protein